MEGQKGGGAFCGSASQKLQHPFHSWDPDFHLFWLACSPVFIITVRIEAKMVHTLGSRCSFTQPQQ